MHKKPKRKLIKRKAEPANLGPWNTARNWTLKARIDEDPIGVLEYWGEADAAAKALAKQGHYVDRSKVDAAARWARLRLTRPDSLT